MSAQTITLTGFALNALRHGREVVVADSGGQPVAVRAEGAGQEEWSGPEVELSRADLDLIESPDGLVVADTTGTTGWTVQVAS